MLTAVAYHYVRDLDRTRYPRINGLRPEEFEGQLDYLQRHYTMCSVREVVAAAQGAGRLPANACVLTFDDGLADHYEVVLPRLRARSVVGCFFPPARAVRHGEVLDVHKIHFVLAAEPDVEQLAAELLRLVDLHRGAHALPSEAELYARFAAPSRFDAAPVAFVKRVLQRGLPERVRAVVVRELFARYVTADEEAFARELYLDEDQLREMVDQGMEVGGHGDRHVWLPTLTPDEQREEIDATRALLGRVAGSTVRDWVMCYPYGSYCDTTIGLLRDAACALAFTTGGRPVASLDRPYELTRVDTTALPFHLAASTPREIQTVAR